jgi:hypothetical protein
MDNIENGQVNKGLLKRKTKNIIVACTVGVGILFSHGASSFIKTHDLNREALAGSSPSQHVALLSKKMPSRKLIDGIFSLNAIQNTVKIHALRARLMGTPAAAKRYAMSKVKNGSQYSCLVKLWTRESNWSVSSHNKEGAYGIPQALPGSKMKSAGADWQYNYKTQVNWGLAYIQRRYGSPCTALSASNARGWY